MKKIINKIKEVLNNKIVKRVLKYTSNMVIAVLIVLVGFSVYGNIQSKGKDWVVPRIGSYRWLTVLSGSMKPTFNPGDLIIDKIVEPSKLKKDDVVTYLYGERFLATHRIIEISNDAKDKTTFKTKGDNNNAADEQPVQESMIVGKFLFRIPLIGFFIQKIKGPVGIIAIWVLFFYVAGSEIYRNFRITRKQKKDGQEVQEETITQ